MKTKLLLIVVALLALSVVACNQNMDEIDNPFHTSELTFEASFGDGQKTRTAIVNDTEVWWTPNDAINVFYGNLASGKFTSNIAEAAASSTFTGSLPAVTGTMETGNTAQSFWAVYPYDIQNSCDGNSVSLTVPFKQKGAEGTFARQSFPAIATSKGLDLAFYNVCGGMVITVTRDDIRSITLSGNNNEVLAGKVRVAFVDDNPSVLEVMNGEQSITFRSPDNKPFVAGSRYFITLLPVEFSEGFSLVFSTESGETGTKEVSDKKNINRSRFLVVNNADSDVSFTASANNPNFIRFADDELKDALVAAFDTDSDRELSYDEAAAVTSPNDILSALGGNKSYSSFDEFQNFTGISSIPNKMFQNWIQLKSIVLPETIRTIGNYAFQNCGVLKEIVLPNSLESLGIDSFSGCSNLASVVLHDCLKTIPSHAFENCTSLTSFVIPSSVTSIGISAFDGCSSLTSFVIPSSMTSIGSNAFYGCSSIEYLYLEDIEMYLSRINGDWTCSNSPLQSTSKPVHVFVAGKEITSVSFAEGTTTIPAYTLRNCAYIKTISLPKGLTSIGDYAFYGCTGLERVDIPSTVTTIGDYCFEKCSSLTKVILSEGNVSIGAYAFRSNYSLTSFEFPASIKTIGKGCLLECKGLTSITVKAIDVPQGDNEMFWDSNCPIYVPEESVEAYKTSEQWKKCANRILPIMAEGDDPEVSGNVTASFSGGSVSIINGLIQNNSKLKYSVYNNACKSVKVLTIQLIDGKTGEVSNMMSADTIIDAGANRGWTIRIGWAGIHSPIAVFVYSCEGKRYEIRVPYPNL